VDRHAPFFQGSELSRLAILSAIMVVGWAAVWIYAQQPQEATEPPLTAGERLEPVAADRSPEFETVTDRTSMSFRDNAAYALLLGRARARTPAELAAESRRDILLTHLWERPDLYRGVPVHLLGTALRVLRYESKLGRSGWLYEAWIITPETTRVPYVCVFEDAPNGLPVGTNISERVVFNGYFLKVMKYDAADVARGAPVLVGRIGWTPHESPALGGQGMNPFLQWSLIVLGALFVISSLRWIGQLRGLFAPFRRVAPAGTGRLDELDQTALDDWVKSVATADSPNSDDDEPLHRS
jgi:hypothetical protein